MRFNSSPCGARGNALWGRGGRVRGRLGGFSVLLALVTALAVPAAGVAGSGGPVQSGPTPGNGQSSQSGQSQNGRHRDAPGPSRYGGPTGPVVPAGLVAAALANPNASFRVIVQGKHNDKSSNVDADIAKENGRLRHSFRSIVGVATTITGRDLIKLTKRSHIEAITPDKAVRTTDYQDAEMWRDTADVASLWNLMDPNTGRTSVLLRRRRRWRSWTAVSTRRRSATSALAS